MKIIITGASGFIGSYFCHYFLEKGFEVIAFARTNISTLEKELPQCQWVQADVLDDALVNLKIEADAIVHLAAANDIVSKRPNEASMLSVNGTRNLLQFAVNNKIPKFLFFSTLQVYGTELAGPITEQSIVKCENDYAMNHWLAEQYVEMFSRKHPLKTAVIRPSNIYGPMTLSSVNRWTLVPGCFCKEALEKQTITLLSSGNQLRNFISLQQLSYITENILKNIQESFVVVNAVSAVYKRIVDMAVIVKQEYETLTGDTIDLQIKSDQPQQTNDFKISLETLNKYNIASSVLAEDETVSQIQQLLKNILQLKK